MLLRDHAPIITATNFVTNSRAKIRFLVDSFISSTLVNYHGQDIVRLKKKKKREKKREKKEGLFLFARIVTDHPCTWCFTRRYFTRIQINLCRNWRGGDNINGWRYDYFFFETIQVFTWLESNRRPLDNYKFDYGKDNLRW